jgi:amino acid transporter
VLAFDFFFTTPYFTFVVDDAEYVLTFIGLFVVGVVVSHLAARAREQAEAAQPRENETAILNSLSRDLAVAAELDAILRAIVANVSQTFGRQIVALLPPNMNVIVLLSLFFILIMTLGNLRGIRESGAIFAAPTYLFIVTLIITRRCAPFRLRAASRRIPSCSTFRWTPRVPKKSDKRWSTMRPI